MAQRHRHDPDDAFFDRGGMDQPVAGLEHDEDHRCGDERRLAEAGQRLGLAVPEAMLAVGRGQRVADGEERDQRGHGVDARIGERGQHGHRIGHQPRHHLHGDQRQRDRDRGVGGGAHQSGAAVRGEGRRLAPGTAWDCWAHRCRRLGVEPLAGPALARPRVEDALVQARGLVAPELDAFCEDAEARPLLGDAARRRARTWRWSWRPPFRARSGPRWGVTVGMPRRRSGRRAGGWRNRRRPQHRRPAQPRRRPAPGGRDSSNAGTTTPAD